MTKSVLTELNNGFYASRPSECYGVQLEIFFVQIAVSDEKGHVVNQEGVACLIMVCMATYQEYLVILYI